MGFIDNIANAMAGVGGAITRVSSALRNPQTAPSVEIPGVPHWGSTTPHNTSETVAKGLRTPEAFMGRVSYDAGPSWTRFSSYPATDLTPQKIVGAQSEAVSGYPLRWVEMIEQVLGRDAHLSGIAQQRVDDVVKGSWRLVRSTNDDVSACLRGFCDESLQGIDGLEDDLAWLLWSNAYSYSAGEVVWVEDKISFPGPRGERIGPVDVVVPRMIEAVHPKHFRFDLRTDEPLLWLGTDQVSLPFGKFIFMPGEGQNPIVERRGYMWPCMWLSLFKSIAWSGWSVYVERFGMPTPLIEYEGDLAQYSEYKTAYQDMLNNLGRGFGTIMPRNEATARMLESPGGGKASDPHSALSDACDAAQSIRILGATLTAKIGNVGSFSASSVHAEVKYAREESDARRLWGVIRSQLLTPIIYFNALPLSAALNDAGYSTTPDEIRRRVPKGMHRVPREIDPVARAGVVSAAINEWGIPVGRERLYHEFDLPQPMDDQDIAAGEPQVIAGGGATIGSAQAAKGVKVDKPESESTAETETEDRRLP